MQKLLKLSAFLLLLPLLTPSYATGTERLSSESAGWTAVMSGKALCRPCQTSYGFAVLTDAKMISACTDSGRILWERSVPGHPEPFLTVFSSDFLLSVCDQKKLSLINPSGLTLWTVKVPFEITNSPLPGRDCRIFVKGKKHIACFGINGVCKWILETEPLRPENLFEMNDGSLIAFLTVEPDGKTAAIRVDPFGEIKESITFSGKIIAAKSSEQGLLLYFAAGAAGLCVIRDGTASTKWTIPAADKAFRNTVSESSSEFLELGGTKGALFTTAFQNTRAIIFSMNDGRVSDFFDIPESLKNRMLVSAANDGNQILFCGKKNAYLYEITGTEIWKADFPHNGDIFSKWNQLFLTQKNNLVICSTNWAMAGFRINQNVSKKQAKMAAQKKGYESYYFSNKEQLAFLDYSDKIPGTMTGYDRKKQLLQGNYGSKEIEFVSGLADFCNAYRTFQMQSASRPNLVQKSVFERDTSGVEKALLQLSAFGTDFFIKDLAVIIRSEKNTALLAAALKSVSECGFDPESKILNAIDLRVQNLPAASDGVLIILCDAVLEICRFMGRPALYSHGMDILNVLLNPQYSTNVRDRARETLKKIAAIKL